MFGKKPLSSSQRGDDESIANFQGVPYTCDQDCRLKIGLLYDSSELSRTDLKDVSYSRQPIRIVIDIGCQLSSVLIYHREGWAEKENRSCWTHPLCKVECLLRHDEVIVAQYIRPSV